MLNATMGSHLFRMEVESGMSKITFAKRTELLGNINLAVSKY